MDTNQSTESVSTPELTDLAICTGKFQNRLNDVINIHERRIVYRHLQHYRAKINTLARANVTLKH